MEDVYVIKVTTRPVPSSLYPSERRYSASTVSGLALVHFTLGLLTLLLSTLAWSLQGLVLSASCLVPTICGILAWRRWYVDRNICIFFYGSLFSLFVAVLCATMSVLDITTFARNGLFAAKSSCSNDSDPELTADMRFALEKGIFGNTTVSLEASEHSDKQDVFQGSFLEISGIDEVEREEIEKVSSEKTSNATVKELSGYVYNEAVAHIELLLMLNVFVASLLEIAWSLLSVKTALRGMNNEMPDAYCGKDPGGNELRTGFKESSPATLQSNIVLRNKHICCSIQSLDSLQSSCNMQNQEPRLPLPESTRELRERVENFLANQVSDHPPVSEINASL